MVWTSDSGSQSSDSRIAALEAAVADLQRRVATLEAAGSSTSTYGSVQTEVNDAVDPWSVPPWPEIVQLLLNGKKIQAIKVYREHFGAGLKEAKDAVEEAERRIRG